MPRLHLHEFYLRIAKETAQLSYCERKKVGALLVKKDNIVSYAYNGTVSGADNVCENEFNETKKEVLHAESNAIAKIARSNTSSKKAVMYVTLSPCIDCAKLIIQARIKAVYYSEKYRDLSGVDFLEQNGIKCHYHPI